MTNIKKTIATLGFMAFGLAINSNAVYANSESATTNVEAPFKVEASQLAMVAGEYSNPNLPLTIKFWEQDGVLMSQAEGQAAFPLSAHSNTEYRFESTRLY